MWWPSWPYGHSDARDRVCNRLQLNAKQTRHHSPAAAARPRSENCRNPNTSFMIPMTGSTVLLRAPSIAFPSAVLSV